MSGSFSAALKVRAAEGFVPVIADLKPFSPKEGDLFRGRDAAEIARALKEAGAPALSVVTEPEHFHGSLSLLRDVVRATGLPVLRKDFIRSRRDLEETAAAGAAAILLIVSMHTAQELLNLYKIALSLGLEPLVETHTASEMESAQQLGATLVGINNRDITRLEKDDGGVAATEALAFTDRRGGLLVSESGLYMPDDVRRALRSGADAVLIGTALLRAEDIQAAYRRFAEAAP